MFRRAQKREGEGERKGEWERKRQREGKGREQIIIIIVWSYDDKQPVWVDWPSGVHQAGQATSPTVFCRRLNRPDAEC